MAAVLLLLAFALRLAPSFFKGPPPIKGDAYSYLDIALNLAAGQGYSSDTKPPYRPSALRTPTYPFFLALLIKIFGFNIGVVIIAQAMLETAMCLMVWLLAKCLLRSSSKALLPLVLVVFLSPCQRYIPRVANEVLATFLLVGLVYLWIRFLAVETWEHAFLCGVVGMLLGYTRPIYVLLPLVVGGWLLWKRPRWSVVAAFAAGCLLIFAPWAVRNYIVFGKWILTQKCGMGISLWCGTYTEKGHYWDTIRHEDGRIEFILPPQAYASEEERERAYKILYAYTNYYKGDVDVKIEGKNPDDVFLALALERIARDPWHYAWLRLKENPYLFRQDLLHSRLVYPNLFLSWFFGLLALLGAYVLRHEEAVWPIVLTIAYTFVVNLPFHTEVRYGAPTYPLVLLLAGCGWQWLRASVFERWEAALFKKWRQGAI